MISIPNVYCGLNRVRIQVLAVGDDEDTVLSNTQDGQTKIYTRATSNAVFRYDPKENTINLFHKEATISRTRY